MNNEKITIPRKIKQNALATSEAPSAKPPKPYIAARIAKSKNMIVHLTIIYSLVFIFE
ncbi:hypothetical protein GCM10027284_35070 [Cyclobacterium sediminis]